MVSQTIRDDNGRAVLPTLGIPGSPGVPCPLFLNLRFQGREGARPSAGPPSIPVTRTASHGDACERGALHHKAGSQPGSFEPHTTPRDGSDHPHFSVEETEAWEGR